MSKVVEQVRELLASANVASWHARFVIDAVGIPGQLWVTEWQHIVMRRNIARALQGCMQVGGEDV